MSGPSCRASAPRGCWCRSDVSEWNHWRAPIIVGNDVPALNDGPVLVTVEYRVAPDHAQAFLEAMQRYGRVRRRDGASRWGIFRDLQHPDIYLESFVVTSWAEHLRQHDRITRADSDAEQMVRSQADGEPVIRHLVYAPAGK